MQPAFAMSLAARPKRAAELEPLEAPDSDVENCSLSPCSTTDTLPVGRAKSMAELREENARLRESLAARSQAPDFANILALARELNEDFDGEAEVDSCGAEVFSISSPRNGELRLEGEESMTQLRQERDEARTALAELRLRYEARDQELRMKFHALMSAVLGRNNDGESSGEEA
mmetsp:Transcript_16641/g.39050  ORF Transcript_16641/g.39050 Transcript_16641/m.39050 type:complete len:174 (-) Transcript_16641:284-805(-)